MNVLLISEDTLRTNSNLNENCFGKWILPAIREAQEMGLMPLIGECFYNKICELVEDGTIGEIENVAYKDLLDSYVQPYLIYQTLTNIVPILNGKLGNIGTVNTTDEHIVSLSQGEQDLLQNYYRERAEFYQRRLSEWVKAHADSFPELSCFCGMEQPHLDRNTNSVGLWLGGMRGRKLAKPCGCGGTTSGGGGGGGDCREQYEAGIREGRAYQKSLIQEKTITENGVYSGANGFSPVIVNVPTGASIEPNKTVSVTGESQTVFPSSGYNGMGRVDIDAFSYGQQRYNQGYSDGSSGSCALVAPGVAMSATNVTFTPASILMPEYVGFSAIGVDCSVICQNYYDSGYTKGYNDAQSGQTGQTIAHVMYNTGVGGINSGDTIWSQYGDATNALVFLNGSRWTGGNIYTGSTQIDTVDIYFVDGIVPASFFSDVSKMGSIYVYNATIKGYAFFNTGAHFIEVSNSFLDNYAISWNNYLTSVTLTLGVTAGNQPISGNHSVNRIFTMSTLEHSDAAFTDSASNGLLSYGAQASGVLNTSWWANLANNGWVAMPL